MRMILSLMGLGLCSTGLAATPEQVAAARRAQPVAPESVMAVDYDHPVAEAKAGPEASSEVEVTQGGLLVTDDTLDLALSGPGFFVLRDQETGKLAFTRTGHFPVDVSGYVVGAATGAQLLFYRHGHLASLNLFALAPTLTHLETRPEGTVVATYADGRERELGTVAIAEPTPSGEMALQEGRGPEGPTVYGAALEVPPEP